MIDAARAAACLHQAWTNHRPIDHLPEGCRPETFADGYAVQEAMHPLMGPIVGWKMAVLPGGESAFAPIYAEWLHRSGATLSAATLPGRLAEIELGFEVIADIEGEAPDAERVRRSVRFVPTIEVLSSRFVDIFKVGMPAFVADGSANGAVIVGEPRASFDMAAASAAIAIDGAAREARPGPEHDPWPRLLWLATELAARGRPLRAGQILATGSIIVPVPATRSISADWGALGRVKVAFE